MAPSVRQVGATSGGDTTSPLTVATPAGANPVVGDLLLMLSEYATGAATNHMTRANWTELAWRSQAAATGRTDIVVMGKIAAGDEGASQDFAIAGTLNHASGRMIAIQNHGLASIADVVVGTVTGGAAGGASPQTNTVPGITVSADSLIVCCGVTAQDTNSTAVFGSFTNSNLANIAEQMDNVVNTGNGGGFGMFTATCAGTSTGDSTYQQATQEAWNAVQLGIKPAAATHALAANLAVAFVNAVAIGRETFIASNLNTSPTLAAAIFRETFLAANLDTSPALAANIAIEKFVAAALAIDPTISVAIGRETFVAAHLDTTPAIAAAIMREAFFAAALDTSPTMSATIIREQFIAAAMDLSTTISSTIIREQFVASALAIAPTIAAALTRETFLASSLPVQLSILVDLIHTAAGGIPSASTQRGPRSDLIWL